MDLFPQLKNTDQFYYFSVSWTVSFKWPIDHLCIFTIK